MASGWFWPIPFQVIQLYICLLEKPILIRRAAAKVYVQHLKPNNRSIHHITAKSDPSIIHRNKNQPQHTHTHTYHTTHHTTHHHHQWIGFHGKILTGNPWVFTIKFDGLSGSNFPIIQFYDIIRHPSPTSQPRRLQGLFQLAHLSVHRGQRRLQRGQGTASDLSHGEAMAHRNRWFKRFKLFLKC